MQPPSRAQRIKQFIIHHKKAVIIWSSVGILVIASGVTAFILLTQPKQAAPQPQAQAKPQEPTPPPPPKFYSPLTGLEVSEAQSKKQVRGIMIENSPEARPQSGVKDAGLVFEAIAEGGITRFLCLYQESAPGLIGPVRSLRPYYLDWLTPFDATVVHIGGSANALKEVRSGKYKDEDQFFNAPYFWRATDRYAPHNVYTDASKLDALDKAKGYDKSSFSGFPRKEEAPNPPNPNATKIDIDISYALFNVHYDYDIKTNSYTRFLAGKPHTDREHGQITPKVVVVMKVPTHRGLEDGYREQMTTTGSGEATVFQDGTVTVGTWHKKDITSQIEFKNAAGESLKLNPGQTWVSVVAPEKSVSWQ